MARTKQAARKTSNRKALKSKVLASAGPLKKALEIIKEEQIHIPEKVGTMSKRKKKSLTNVERMRIKRRARNGAVALR
jgi:hypothetical protein